MGKGPTVGLFLLPIIRLDSYRYKGAGVNLIGEEQRPCVDAHVCLLTLQAGRRQMDLTDNTSIVVVALIVVVLVIVAGLAIARAQRTKHLQERFGPEYQRTVNEMGDKRQAERELQERISYLNILRIRPLTAEEVNRYALEWQKTQAEFVDEPLPSLQKADHLIQEVMKLKGYPVEDFEQRAALISVDYPDLVTDYRGMHGIAVKEAKDNVSTEDIRQAMVHGRALFESLIKQEPKAENVNQNQKEHI
jgi:hypothetical protein